MGVAEKKGGVWDGDIIGELQERGGIKGANA